MALQHLAHDVSQPAGEGRGLRERVERRREVVSPYLTTSEACDLLRYVGKHRLRSLYRFIQTNGVPVTRRSPRCLLVKRADLDAVLRRGGKGQV